MSLTQKTAQLVDQLIGIASEHPSVAFANSLSIEDMVLTHLILEHNIPVEIFSLDTGRLHPETLQVIDDVHKRYGYRIAVFYPDAQELQDYVASNGINGFYNSVEQRKGCCHVRKVRPLQRALQGKDAWITGMRRSHGETRTDLEQKQWDGSNNLWKYSPLADWQEDEIWQLIRDNDIPYNSLYDNHYASIGCQPCTRSITMGEDVRAGRWWWEDPQNKECGLHVEATPVTILPSGAESSEVSQRTYDGGDQG
ncbi:MAG: phosphoadenylyl-sulfate reductase [Porticoccaceae bacterium]|nr:phosphoadenylyl-sulfate reductase [Porticoccaceae bacterium]